MADLPSDTPTAADMFARVQQKLEQDDKAKDAWRTRVIDHINQQIEQQLVLGKMKFQVTFWPHHGAINVELAHSKADVKVMLHYQMRGYQIEWVNPPPSAFGNWLGYTFDFTHLARNPAADIRD